jgi:hypothetical protein
MVKMALEDPLVQATLDGHPLSFGIRFTGFDYAKSDDQVVSVLEWVKGDHPELRPTDTPPILIVLDAFFSRYGYFK